MTPVPFAQVNEWSDPAGAKDVEPLPYYKSDTGPISISCWKANWRERLTMLLTGRVWVCMPDKIQPPLTVRGRNPFTTS